MGCTMGTKVSKQAPDTEPTTPDGKKHKGKQNGAPVAKTNGDSRPHADGRGPPANKDGSPRCIDDLDIPYADGK